jgi:hypothetical protein
MPLTIFDTKGISGTRRERIEAAVEFGGKHLTAPHEAWIATDQHGRVRVMITGPRGFQRTVPSRQTRRLFRSLKWSGRRLTRSKTVPRSSPIKSACPMLRVRQDHGSARRCFARRGERCNAGETGSWHKNNQVQFSDEDKLNS